MLFLCFQCILLPQLCAGCRNVFKVNGWKVLTLLVWANQSRFLILYPWLWFPRIDLRLSVCTSVNSFICLSVRLSVCKSFLLSVWPSVCLSVWLTIRPSVCKKLQCSVIEFNMLNLRIKHIKFKMTTVYTCRKYSCQHSLERVCLSDCLSVCPSICMSICLNFFNVLWSIGQV